MDLDKFKKVSAGAYLAMYIMEAVGFSEFLYEESTQQYLRVLKSMKKKGTKSDMVYMAVKGRDNILVPAWAFHKNFGILNPWTYPGFEAFYVQAWEQLDSIIKLPGKGKAGDPYK